MQTRNRLHVFTLVQTEFEKAGITQAELAGRLGKGTDQVCKMFSAPGNWTNDTISDYLWAISGAEIEYKVTYPLEKSARNHTQPEWLDKRTITGTNRETLTRKQPSITVFAEAS